MTSILEIWDQQVLDLDPDPDLIFSAGRRPLAPTPAFGELFFSGGFELNIQLLELCTYNIVFKFRGGFFRIYVRLYFLLICQSIPLISINFVSSLKFAFNNK